MKKPAYLKWLRVILAILFFIPVLLLFLDFRNQFPENWSKLLHLQIFPAILSGMVGIVIFQFVLAFLFGRVYCSVMCPAGILQDIINRIFCIGKKKKNGIKRFNYHKPNNWLRYSLLALVTVLGVLGFMELCLLLEPYSNFGRITTNLFRPIVIWGNNILAELLAKADNYTLYHVSVSTVTIAGLTAGIIALLVFIVMVSFRGRLFCNTLCPVGTLLSLISRYSVFKISIDKKTCISCGSCEHTCKVEAINIADYSVDSSRCVDCFNCISSCPKGSILYNLSLPWKKAIDTSMNEAANLSEPIKVATNSRRTFLATSATVVASLPVVSTVAQCKNRNHRGRKGEKISPVTPPGSMSLKQFKDKCTGCHACVVQCPSQVLRPAGLEFGLGYLLRPHMSYIDSYCNYECTVCSDVCPTHAIHPITKEEKVTTQVGVAKFYLNRCIVKTENTDCGACSEHCPTQAVHMEPFKAGSTLTIPVVEPDLCIGCGGCESICPVRPARAIIVRANDIHQQVEKPKEEEVLDIQLDGFGF